MRRLPRDLPRPVVKLVRWADASNASPLTPDRVPGAEGPELSRLAALGALARELAPSTLDEWPEPLASWARDADVTVESSVTDAVRESLESSDGDVLALAYEQIVSGVNRRQLGTFFTPPSIVEYMIEQSKKLLAVPPKNIVDPGAGVGAFTLASLTSWRKAVVTAVDVNVVTLGLLAARVAVKEVKVTRGANRLVLAPDDYLNWLQERWGELDGPRLILGNPPYTRHQCMTKKEKESAQTIAGNLITSGLAGLSAYFLAATLRALGPKDAACFLLPASWCETRYGREMRQWLWGARTRRVEVQFFPSDVAVFPGTQVTAMVLLVGPIRRSEQPFVVRHIELKSVGSHSAVTHEKSVEPDRNESCPPTFTGLLRRPVRWRKRETVTLGAVAAIRRGVATGASEFFFLTDPERYRYQLPSQSLRRAIVKPAHCTEPCLDIRAHDAIAVGGFPCWLLDLNHTDLATNPFVASYLFQGRILGVDTRYLPRNRPEWYLVEQVKAPDLFLVPVGKPYHRVILNEAGAVGSNNLYGISLSESAPWCREELARWLRSDEGLASLADLARHYHGGSLKIEPGILRTLKVPVAIA